MPGSAFGARAPATADDPRSWVASRIGLLEREAARSADTHLLLLELPAFPGVRLPFSTLPGWPPAEWRCNLPWRCCAGAPACADEAPAAGRPDLAAAHGAS